MRIHINNVSHDFAGSVILSRINATVTSGERIGIVGPNGGGKSTLLRILVGELEPITGTVSVGAGTRIGYVPQSMSAPPGLSVAGYLLQELLEIRGRLRALEEEMGSAGDRLDRVLTEYERVRDRYDARHGDSAEERAERLLGQLGLSARLDQQLATLSGGEQNVLALAQAVLERPDLLVLDEPGNHLDFAGLAWLEEYLRTYDGAIVVVSHNRYLLDRIAQTIWELEHSKLTCYTGNYSDYRFERLGKALSDQATYKVQQEKLARLTELVRTFEERARVTADPAWGKRLRARRTQLEKARSESIDQPRVGEERIEPVFQRTDVRSDLAVDVRSFEASFGARTLLKEASLTVNVGERVGVVGPNGSGKTTFLERLVHNGSWEHPSLRVGPSMKIGYCSQKRDRFPATTSVFDAMLTAGSFTRHEVFGVLSHLRFEWEDVERAIGSLSGGEWNRLQLAIAIIAKANLLILDEPTNHLDIPSREAVEEAMREFDGTVIAVSHDRYFLDAVTTRIVELTEHRFVSFEGDFTAFWHERSNRHATDNRRAKQNLTSRRRAVHGSRSPSPRTTEAETTPKTANVEREIMRLEEEQRRLESAMNDAFESGDYRKGRKAGNELSEVRKRIDELYARWS